MRGYATEERSAVASTDERICGIIAGILTKAQRSPAFAREDTLVDIGLTSIDMVSLMLDVEREFDLEIPQEEITPEAFHSVSTIAALVLRLAAGGQRYAMEGAPPAVSAPVCVDIRAQAVTSRMSAIDNPS